MKTLAIAVCVALLISAPAVGSAVSSSLDNAELTERVEALDRQIIREFRDRRSFDSQLARCGRLASAAWRQQADRTWDLGVPQRARAWSCFVNLRTEIRTSYAP